MTADLRPLAGAPPAVLTDRSSRARATSAVGWRLGDMPALTGLRGVAALAVLTYHSWNQRLPGGFIGVDVFFVLSGFLITGLLLRERALTGRISLLHFYSRRALRLMPALVVLLAACVALVTLAPGLVFAAATVDGVRGALAYVANWQFAARADGLGLLSHTWSLSLEEQFYLLWPPLLMALLLWGGRVVALLGCIAGIGASVEVRLLLEWHGSSWHRLYAGLDTRADALLIGCALALAADLGYLSRLPRRATVVGGMCGLAALAGVALTVRSPSVLPWWGYSLVAVSAAALITALALQPSNLVARALGCRPLIATGKLSYGIYLWHYPILVVLLNATPAASWSGPARLCVVLGLTWCAAAVSWVLVERPCLRIKDSLVATARTAASTPREVTATRPREHQVLPGTNAYAPAPSAVPLQ